MNRNTPRSLPALACLALGMLFFLHDTAEARLGRGRSFGSRPSYQRSAPAPQRPAPAPANPAPTAQPGVGGAPMGRGGLLGGLLMGSIVGSLLFGGGHAGGLGLLDLLLLGGGAVLLMRFLRARRAAPAGAGGLAFEGLAGQTWGPGVYSPGSEAAPGAEPPALPPGFDAKEFLEGAQAIYARLQASWDRRDLEDIRQFTSPEVFEAIARQAAEDPEPGKTALLLVAPTLLEVREVDGQTVASVLYDAMLRETGDPSAGQVRELWHFSRDAGRPEAFWVLEGIQQIET